MNSKVYKYFGLVLIILSSIVILISLPTIFYSLAVPEWASLGVFFILLMLSPIIVSVLFGLFPGIYYYKFGKQNKKDNSLIKTALLLKMISLILVILIFIISMILALVSFKDEGATAGALSTGFVFLALSIIPSVAYFIGLVLMVIRAFTNNSDNKAVDKTTRKKHK